MGAIRPRSSEACRLAEFRRRMAEEGIEELAFATYPPEGEEVSGYTYAQIIDAGEEKTAWIIDTINSILMGSMAKMHYSGT
jgi:hypothetical protein